MVERTKEICGNPPSLQIIYKKICDECGSQVSGCFNDQKLWKYHPTGDELCLNCLLEVLEDGGFISEV